MPVLESFRLFQGVLERFRVFWRGLECTQDSRGVLTNLVFNQKLRATFVFLNKENTSMNREH